MGAISSLLKKGFDSEQMYNDKYIKTKIKIYNDRINTNFQGNKIPKYNEYYFLSVVLLDFVVNVDNDYYPQIFLVDSKHLVKKIYNEYN